MRVILINGPINAGKTTTGRALAGLLLDARFVDGDDHGVASSVPFLQRIERAFVRLELLIASNTNRYLVIAYPLRDEDFRRLKSAADARGAKVYAVTLAPSLDIAYSNRGTRELQPHEVERAREMHAEGYARRSFSDLIITDMTSPETTAETIIAGLGLLSCT